jgi:hypothetical protein
MPVKQHQFAPHSPPIGDYMPPERFLLFHADHMKQYQPQYIGVIIIKTIVKAIMIILQIQKPAKIIPFCFQKIFVLHSEIEKD